MRLTATIITDANGDGVAWLGPATGRVDSLSYEHTTFAATADVVFAIESSNRTVLTLTNVAASAKHSAVIQAAASDGSELVGVFVPIYLDSDRIRVAVSAAGASKVGTVAMEILE